MSEVKYYPLTHSQKGIWYIDKKIPNTRIGVVAGTLRLKGQVDYLLFEKAVNMFVQKNDGMRLRIVDSDGKLNRTFMVTNTKN